METNDSACDSEIVDAVRAVRAGDAQAYARIVNRYQGPLMTLGMALVSKSPGGRRAAQDVLVRAYERLHLFDERQAMKPWLFKIMCRLAQERRRATTRVTALKKRPRSRVRRAASIWDPPREFLRANNRRCCGRLFPHCRWPNGRRLCCIIVRI